MSDINALLQPIETRIERLEGDHGSKFAEPMDAQLAAWEQVRATLLLAHETKRIADALEAKTDYDVAIPR